MIDFYDACSTSEAKRRLLEDAGNISSADKLPHIPKRCDGANRTVHDLDDISE